MIRIFRSDLIRLKKSVMFWICIGVAAALPIFLTMFTSGKEGASNVIFIIGLSMISPFSMALIPPAIIGKDFHCGTLRNKLTVGHTRANVWFSYLAICVLAGFSVQLAYLAAFCVIGLPFLGATTIPFGMTIWYIVNGFLLTIVFASVHQFTAVTAKNATTSAVSSLVLAFVTFMAMQAIISTLNAPEFFEGLSGLERNPGYISGGMRIFLTELVNILPMGQSLRLCAGELAPISQDWPKLLYSLGIITLTNVGGLLLFRKADLK